MSGIVDCALLYFSNDQYLCLVFLWRQQLLNYGCAGTGPTLGTDWHLAEAGVALAVTAPLALRGA